LSIKDFAAEPQNLMILQADDWPEVMIQGELDKLDPDNPDDVS
jgi:hypothetical protein